MDAVAPGILCCGPAKPVHQPFPSAVMRGPRKVFVRDSLRVLPDHSEVVGDDAGGNEDLAMLLLFRIHAERHPTPDHLYPVDGACASRAILDSSLRVTPHSRSPVGFPGPGGIAGTVPFSGGLPAGRSTRVRVRALPKPVEAKHRGPSARERRRRLCKFAPVPADHFEEVAGVEEDAGRTDQKW